MRLRNYILCLDAGFRNLGIAVYSIPAKTFIKAECVSVLKNSTLSVSDDCRNTLEEQVFALDRIIEQYPPILVLAELPTGASRSSRAVRAMAQAFATVVVFCSAKNLDLRAIRPSEIKSVVRRNRRRNVSDSSDHSRSVDKDEVITFVRRRYGALLNSVKRSKQEHIADAMVCLDAMTANPTKNV